MTFKMIYSTSFIVPPFLRDIEANKKFTECSDHHSLRKRRRDIG